jgi:hypothetical protein
MRSQMRNETFAKQQVQGSSSSKRAAAATSSHAVQASTTHQQHIQLSDMLLY